MRVRTARVAPAAAPLICPNGQHNRADGVSERELGSETGIGYGALIAHKFMEMHPRGSAAWWALREARDRMLEESEPWFVRVITGIDATADRKFGPVSPLAGAA